MDINKTAKGTLFVFVSTFLGLGLSYLFNIYVARWFGSVSFGQFSLGLTLFNVVALFSVFGMEGAILKYMPEYQAKDVLKGGSTLVASVMIICGILSSLLSIALYLSADWLALVVFHDFNLSKVFKLFSLGVPAYVVSVVLLSVLQSQHNVYYRMIVKYIAEPVFKILLTIILVAIGMEIESAISGFVFALWLSVILALMKVKKFTSFSSCEWGGEYGIANTIRRLYIFALPLLIGLLFITLANRSDYIFIGYYSSSSDVGLYAASYQTTAIIIIILQSLESILAPHLSESLNSESSNKIHSIYSMSLRWSLILGVPVYVIFMAYSEEILSIFGEEFRSASIAFMILATGHFINLSTGSSNYILLFLGKTKWIMKNQIVNALSLVVLNYFLVDQYGILGASISMLVATLVVNGLRVWQVYLVTGVQPYEMYLLKPLVFGLIFYFILKISQEYGVIERIVLFAVGVIFYGVVIIRLGMRDVDKEALNAVLPVRLRKAGGS